MSKSSIAYRGVKAVALAAAATLLCGFTFREGGPPELHYEQWGKRPVGNTISVCHSHGCAEMVPFIFTAADIADLAVLMDYARTEDTPAQERRALAYAIGWMERRVGPATGTQNDQASLSFISGSGQLDCVDEATNATSYLLVLQHNGLLRHHRVIRPFSKASLFKWPHFAAMIEETSSRKVYAVDSGVGPNGTNPAITLASQWYIAEGYAQPEAARVRSSAPAATPPPVPVGPVNTDLGALVEQVLREAPPAPQPGTLNYAASKLRLQPGR